MGMINGPNAITPGLVACYDAGSNRSYSRNRFISYGSVGSGSGADNNVTFSINGSGTFVRLGYGQTYGGYTIKQEDVVYKYTLGSNGCHYHGNTAIIPAGCYASFYFDYYIDPNATNYPVDSLLANFENYGGGALGGSISAPNSTKGVWQRVGFTSGPTNSVGTQAMFLYPGSCGPRLADSGYILYKNPMVIFSNTNVGDVYANTSDYTHFSNNTVVYNTAGTVNGTLTNGVAFDDEGFVFDGTNDYIDLPSNIQSGYTAASYEFVVRTGTLPSSTYHQLYIQESSTWIALYNYGGVTFFGIDLNNGSGWFDNNGGHNSGARTFTTLASNTKYHVVYTWNGSTVKIYLNGNLESTTSTLQAANGRTNVTVLGAGTTPRMIGSRGSGSNPWPNRIYQAKFYSNELTQVQVSQLYEMNKTRFGV
jgi:hypothetical protein